MSTDGIPKYYLDYTGPVQYGFEHCSKESCFGIPHGVEVLSRDEPIKLQYSPTSKIDTKASASTDAATIQEGLKSKDLYTKHISSILCSRSPQQVIQICKEFEKIDKPLWQRVKQDLPEPYKYIVMTLIHPPVGMRSYILYHSFVEAKTKDIDSVIYILMTHTEKEIEEIKIKYKTTYESSLECEIKSKTTGFLQKALLALLEKKEKTTITPEEIKTYVDMFMKDKIDTEDAKEKAITLLCRSTKCVIHKVIRAYEMAEKDALEHIFSPKDQFQKCLRSIVLYTHDPAKYYAQYIREGIEEEVAQKLSNVFALRYHTDLGHIAHAYSSLYSVSLGSDIMSSFTKSSESADCLRKLLGEL